MKSQSEHYAPSVEDGYSIDMLKADHAERDRLRAQVAALTEALHTAQELRPILLHQYGAVPECVLTYCNMVRAALAKLEEYK